MNETRVRTLAKEKQVELTKKLLKRFCRQCIDLHAVMHALSQSELKEENVLAYPDYNYKMGLPGKGRKWDVIITQTADGRAVRIVGYVDRNTK